MYSVSQSSPTLPHLMDCSQPGSSVHGILQARILEWVDISSSRGSFLSGDGTRSPALQADSLPLNHLESPNAGPRESRRDASCIPLGSCPPSPPPSFIRSPTHVLTHPFIHQIYSIPTMCQACAEHWDTET